MFQNNNGNVLTYHCFDDKYRGELERITGIYHDNFIKPLEEPKKQAIECKRDADRLGLGQLALLQSHALLSSLTFDVPTNALLISHV